MVVNVAKFLCWINFWSNSICWCILSIALFRTNLHLIMKLLKRNVSCENIIIVSTLFCLSNNKSWELWNFIISRGTLWFKQPWKQQLFYITHVVDKSVYKSQDKWNIINPISTLFKLLYYLHLNSESKNEFLSFVGIVFV